ncbi:TPA: hypothetical protein ACQUIL_005641 [Bacillus tropicus]
MCEEKKFCSSCGITLTAENRCYLFVKNLCCWKCSGKKKEIDSDLGKGRMYKLYLGDEFYGKGDLEYIHQLITDFMLARRIYLRNRVELKIIEFDE